MIIRKIEEARGTKRDVEFNAGRSVRLILEEDKMGFSFHVTEMEASVESYHWHYKHHLESCYCVSGKGVITDLASGVSTVITPGTIYILDNNDDHTFLPIEDTVLISVFNPPCKGSETHKEDGSYE